TLGAGGTRLRHGERSRQARCEARYEARYEARSCGRPPSLKAWQVSAGSWWRKDQASTLFWVQGLRGRCCSMIVRQVRGRMLLVNTFVSSAPVAQCARELCVCVCVC
ncbi:unnamed protein product, partial [Scytosiphon promiscuus]